MDLSINFDFFPILKLILISIPKNFVFFNSNLSYSKFARDLQNTQTQTQTQTQNSNTLKIENPNPNLNLSFFGCICLPPIHKLTHLVIRLELLQLQRQPLLLGIHRSQLLGQQIVLGPVAVDIGQQLLILLIQVLCLLALDLELVEEGLVVVLQVL